MTPRSSKKKIKIKRKRRYSKKQVISSESERNKISSKGSNKADTHQDNNVDEGEEYEGVVIARPKRKKLPSPPIRLIVLSVLLFICGIVLIILGFVKEVKSVDPLDGILCWVLGVLTFIPGLFYTIKVVQVFREENPNIRRDIIQEIV